MKNTPSQVLTHFINEIDLPITRNCTDGKLDRHPDHLKARHLINGRNLPQKP
ncbi:hypothetical protein [Mucilaginibacter xinganensis]|uniref:Uncharacterized protein n=1 Tax=Mucilaginibacter xinganensis TaxID=1234841 RepID=A0A223P3U6_9SPHI|nr:hypothetical protein [Mucilaginibacter xinganensis]ASU36756.1 hypothetical protein MuYL_4873 [Mucilaginibacter xinganensis]